MKKPFKLNMSIVDDYSSPTRQIMWSNSSYEKNGPNHLRPRAYSKDPTPKNDFNTKNELKTKKLRRTASEIPDGVKLVYSKYHSRNKFKSELPPDQTHPQKKDTNPKNASINRKFYGDWDPNPPLAPQDILFHLKGLITPQPPHSITTNTGTPSRTGNPPDRFRINVSNNNCHDIPTQTLTNNFRKSSLDTQKFPKQPQEGKGKNSDGQKPWLFGVGYVEERIRAEGHGGSLEEGGGGGIGGTGKKFYKVSRSGLDGESIGDLIKIHKEFSDGIEFGRKGSKEEFCNKDGKDGNIMGSGNNFYKSKMKYMLKKKHNNIEFASNHDSLVMHNMQSEQPRPKVLVQNESLPGSAKAGKRKIAGWNRFGFATVEKGFGNHGNDSRKGPKECRSSERVKRVNSKRGNSVKWAGPKNPVLTQQFNRGLHKSSMIEVGPEKQYFQAHGYGQRSPSVVRESIKVGNLS